MTRRAAVACLALLTGAACARFAPTTPPPSPHLSIQPIPNQPDGAAGHQRQGQWLRRDGHGVQPGAEADLSGQRHPQHLPGQSGQGSPCEGGFTETYQVTVTFVRASEVSGEGGRGQLQRWVCDPLARQYRPDPAQSGELEVARQ